MKKFIYPLLAAQTLLLLVLSFDIYFELTNPKKINDRRDAVLGENLDDLTAAEAFLKLGKHGFRVLERNIGPGSETETVIAPPYQVGIIGFFMVKIPFDYVVKINSSGIVSSYGLKK